MTKLIVVIGITGNQGGSVAKRFLQDPDYRVRGITRSASSPAAQALAAQGVEIVEADLNYVESLLPAVKGANVVFSVTQYWEPFFSPSYREEAAQLGMPVTAYAGMIERAQGMNIVDAVAATQKTLEPNGFLVSTLSHAGKCSKGKITDLYHFDAKADIFPDYVEEKYPALARKMSCVQTGYFMTSYKLATDAYLRKTDNGTFQMSFPISPNAKVPHLAVNEDLGTFIHAVSKLSAGKSYMAEGTTCSWSEYMATWSRVTGLKGVFKQISMQELSSLGGSLSDANFAKEFGVMLQYSGDPGYDGGEKLIKAEDIRKMGIRCPMTTLEEFMEGEDWSSVPGIKSKLVEVEVES